MFLVVEFQVQCFLNLYVEKLCQDIERRASKIEVLLKPDYDLVLIKLH